MPRTPRCWLIWCVPTGTTTARSPETARRRGDQGARPTHQNLIWARTRHTNALRSALREYYPAALEAFDDLADRDALAILGRAPTPARRERLSLSRSGPHSKPLADNATSTPGPARSRRCCAPSSSPPPPRSPRVRRHHQRRGQHHRRTEPPDQRPRSRAGGRILRHTRTPTSTSPCQDSVSSSAPGCSVNSGTTRTDIPTPSVARTTPEPHH